MPLTSVPGDSPENGTAARGLTAARGGRHAGPPDDDAGPVWADRISPTVENVPVAALLPPDSPRVDGEVAEHVRALADTAVATPPLVVHRSSMRVIDGAHRLRAAQIAGRSTVAVRFFSGSDAEAFALAVALNADHGLPLTAADRAAAADRLIRAFGQWSDRRIAAVTRLSPNTVRALRRQSTDTVPLPTVRVGRDGRVRPLSTADQRRSAADLLRQDSGTSLRAIARRTGISVNTVKDVAHRIENGIDPVPAARRRGPSPVTPLRHAPTSPAAAKTEDLLTQLWRDPSMRSSEFARSLLRVVQMQMLLTRPGTPISARIPQHCRPAVRELARACAEMWARLADDAADAG